MKRMFVIFFLSLLINVTIAGESPNIGDLQVFPENNPWNWDISVYEVHPNSENFIDSIGPNKNLHPDFGTMWQGVPNGIPFIVVHSSQPLIPIIYTRYGNESDPGPFPIPLDAPIEGGPSAGGDRHVIALDVDNKMLYELYKSYPGEEGWEARSGVKFDLTSNAVRTAGWTSADAAGLAIFPGLVRYEEVHIKKEIKHALRFTVSKTRREFIYPARHFASESDDPNYAPMGLRLRLKADFDISGFSQPIQVILRALKKYGMIVADNGSDWFISGVPDDRWDDDILSKLKSIDGYNFEVIKTVDDQGNPIFPSVTSLKNTIPASFELNLQNYPNPFNPKTIIKYQLPWSGNVKLVIFDITGRKVKTLLEDRQPAGPHSIIFDASGFNSGVYFYQLEAVSEKNNVLNDTNQMLLIK